MPSALDLAAKADQWFGGTLDLRTLSSPASLAKGLLSRIGVSPPLERLSLGDKGMDRWVAHLSGGWLEANPDYIGRPTPVVPFDLRSAYALSWCLTDCWSVLTADHLEELDQTETFKHLLKTTESGPWFQPYWWKRLGCTLVQVLPDGEPWPVELGNLHRAYVPLTSKRPMWFPWQTVVAAAVLSGKTPNVLSATKLVPVGTQHLHNVEILPDLKIRAHQDPVPALVKARAEHPELKWLIECLVWGIQAEFHKVGKHETPGPWCFPPIAATVAAGPRLLLALLDRMVRDAGGSVVYRDTDSSYVTGRVRPTQLREMMDRFGPLDQGWGVWKFDPPCNILVRDVKKYITFDNQGNLLDWKESNLRGTYEDPPGHPNWTEDYHERIVARLLNRRPTEPQIVPTYLTAHAIQRRQNKPGMPGRPGAYRLEDSGDSLLTRLRMWHRDRTDHGPDHIDVTSVRYQGSPADAIKANRDNRDIDRADYGRTCPGCGNFLPEKCRIDKVYCGRTCQKRCQRRAS